MGEKNNSAYSKAIGQRLLKIMEIAGLEIAGFAEFTEVSESHLYALINGTRNITGEMADKIGIKFKLQGWQILNLDVEIPGNIKKAPLLTKFYTEHKGNLEYFIETKSKRKDSHYLENELLKSSLFSEPVYVWEVKAYCADNHVSYSSKKLSQMLNYMVQTGKLVSEKKPLKKKDGELAEREVLVYSIKKKKN